MRFGTSRTPFGEIVADRLAQTFQPMPCPCEFDTEYRQPDRYNDQCRTGRNYHDNAYCENGATKHGYRNAARGLIRHVSCFLNHMDPQGIVLRLLFVL